MLSKVVVGLCLLALGMTPACHRQIVPQTDPAPDQTNEALVASLRDLITSVPLSPDSPVAAHELRRTPQLSIHVISVRGEVPLHLHARHAETVVVLEGSGTFVMADEEHLVGPGSILHIPVQTAHAFRNQGNIPTRVVSIFSPPFDGHDRVPLN